MRCKCGVGGVALVVLFGGWSAVQAAVLQPASIFFTVDGQRFDVSTTVAGRGAAVGDGGPLIFEDAEFRVSITGFLDPDPSIAYGIAVTDFGAPSSFAFAFFTPIVPVGFPNTVLGSVSGGLTDFTGNGVSITPLLADSDGDGVAELQVATVQAPTTTMGVDVGLPFSSGPGTPGANYVYGAYAAGPMPGPGPGPWTGLSLTTSFLLSGDGDIAALTGFASIEPEVVPEPMSLVLLGSGLLGIALRRRQRW
ncbi:MAG: PEP-CTERM sorting domain-containing protein [Vicinamibacterales bacterium]